LGAERRRAVAGGEALLGAGKADRGTSGARERAARANGRGPIDHATKVTPVKRGPPPKPWKAERGSAPPPRGLARGHAKGAQGPKAGTAPNGRANGLSRRAATPGSGKAHAKQNTGPKPKGGAKPNGKAGLAKPEPAAKAKADSAAPHGGKGPDPLGGTPGE
jgi:hypothetical protein